MSIARTLQMKLKSQHTQTSAKMTSDTSDIYLSDFCDLFEEFNVFISLSF